MHPPITRTMTRYKAALGTMGNGEILLVALISTVGTGLAHETTHRSLYGGLGGFLAAGLCLWAVLFRRVRVTTSARGQHR